MHGLWVGTMFVLREKACIMHIAYCMGSSGLYALPYKVSNLMMQANKIFTRSVSSKRCSWQRRHEMPLIRKRSRTVGTTQEYNDLPSCIMLCIPRLPQKDLDSDTTAAWDILEKFATTNMSLLQAEDALNESFRQSLR
jgi:hypothetical protein